MIFPCFHCLNIELCRAAGTFDLPDFKILPNFQLEESRPAAAGSRECGNACGTILNKAGAIRFYFIPFMFFMVRLYLPFFVNFREFRG